MEESKNRKNKIYLTFDDGPTPGVTNRVLSLLDEYNAKATFFCLGSNVEKYSDLFNEIRQKEHGIGNHSFSHLNGWKTGRNKYYNDIQKAHEVIGSKLFRPPYGKISVLQWFHLRKKFRIILWTKLSRDYDSSFSAEAVLKRIKKASHVGAVIVFHDTEKAWPRLEKILPLYLEYLEEKNFTCLPIE